MAQESARLEAEHGDRDRGLELFDAAIDSYQRAGNRVDLAGTLVDLAVFFHRVDEPSVAAIMFGASTSFAATTWASEVPVVLRELSAMLGDVTYDRCLADGAAMGPAEAIRFARDHIHEARVQESLAP